MDYETNHMSNSGALWKAASRGHTVKVILTDSGLRRSDIDFAIQKAVDNIYYENEETITALLADPHATGPRRDGVLVCGHDYNLPSKKGKRYK
jgi:hypothetical protein